jgi:hypothetical protein
MELFQKIVFLVTFMGLIVILGNWMSLLNYQTRFGKILYWTSIPLLIIGLFTLLLPDRNVFFVLILPFTFQTIFNVSFSYFKSKYKREPNPTFMKWKGNANSDYLFNLFVLFIGLLLPLFCISFLSILIWKN